VSSVEGNPAAADMKVGSLHGLGRLVEEIRHVLDLRLTDCSNRFVQSVRNLDEGDHRLADCQERGDLVCQRLVACDAAKREGLVEALAKRRNIKLTSPSPPKLPNATFPLCPPSPEGGLPPLADG